jgi:hypothetical protein
MVTGKVVGMCGGVGFGGGVGVGVGVGVAVGAGVGLDDELAVVGSWRVVASAGARLMTPTSVAALAAARAETTDHVPRFESMSTFRPKSYP